MSRFAARFGTACAVGTFVGRATAQTVEEPAPVEPIRIAYDASASCPTRDDFIRDLSARTRRVRPAMDGEPARTFEVRIAGSESEVSGQLRIAGLDGSVTERSLTGKTCFEVASGLALIAAVTVDPKATTPPPAEAEVPPPRATPEGQPAPPSAVVAIGAQPTTVLADSGERVALIPETRPWPGQIGIGAALDMLVGFVPAPGLGADLFFDLRFDRRAAIGPTARITARFAAASPSFTSGVGAEMNWWAARLELCPFRPRIIPRLEASACALVEAGMLYVRGTGLSESTEDSDPWLTAGLSFRLAWNAFSNVDLEVGAGAVGVLRRYSFQYQLDQGVVEAFQAPPAAGLFTFGAGYRFP